MISDEPVFKMSAHCNIFAYFSDGLFQQISLRTVIHLQLSYLGSINFHPTLLQTVNNMHISLQTPGVKRSDGH